MGSAWFPDPGVRAAAARRPQGAPAQPTIHRRPDGGAPGDRADGRGRGAATDGAIGDKLPPRYAQGPTLGPRGEGTPGAAGRPEGAASQPGDGASGGRRNGAGAARGGGGRARAKRPQNGR